MSKAFCKILLTSSGPGVTKYTSKTHSIKEVKNTCNKLRHRYSKEEPTMLP